jgi:CHAT domain-containing protein
VAPWLEALPAEVGALVIVPDPLLRSLPFEALPRDRDGGHPLVEDFAVAYVPSATALAELAAGRTVEPLEMVVLAGPSAVAARNAAHTGAAGATPTGRRLRALYEEEGHDLSPLAFGEVEARRVAAHAGPRGRLLTATQATEALAKSPLLERATVLHFASHGLLSPGDPGRSALLLAADAAGREDGFLQAREIEHLRLAADLVVLAACRTARGQPGAGGAVQSLAEAFFRAGARSVVGTLWEIEDRSAMELATAFYAQLARGADKAQALRNAKLELRRRGAPPRDWAGFVLLGEPAGRVPLSGGRPGTAGVTSLAASAPSAAVAALLFALSMLALAAFGGRLLARRRPPIEAPGKTPPLARSHLTNEARRFHERARSGG